MQFSFLFFFWLRKARWCAILFPNQGSNPSSPAVEGIVLTTGQPGKSRKRFFQSWALDGEIRSTLIPTSCASVTTPLCYHTHPLCTSPSLSIPLTSGIIAHTEKREKKSRQKKASYKTHLYPHPVLYHSLRHLPPTEATWWVREATLS